MCVCVCFDGVQANADERVAALRNAVAVHNARVRESTLGQGCDRHLFGASFCLISVLLLLPLLFVVVVVVIVIVVVVFVVWWVGG
jgi:hypothetical protein